MPEIEGADVLNLSWSGRVGGIERALEIVLREAAGRRGRRHRAGFLAGDGPIGDALVRDRIAWRFGMTHGADPRGLWRLRRHLRRQPPRLLHLHTVALGATVTALRSTRATVVYTEHFPRLVDRPLSLRLLYLLLRRRGATAIAPSAGMARRMASCGLPADRIAVVPNPCGVALRSAVRRPDGPPIVGCVTRLVAPARVDLLVEIVARLRADGAPCRALVVGDGPERRALEDLAERRLGPGVATFAGEQADVVTWLDRMDLFLFTREIAVYPLALIEAMARRVPVVALRCDGGAAEIVAAAGLPLADRDPANGATSIGRLLGAADARERLVERGLRFAAEHAPAAVLDRLEAVYEAAELRAAGESPA